MDRVSSYGLAEQAIRYRRRWPTAHRLRQFPDVYNGEPIHAMCSVRSIIRKGHSSLSCHNFPFFIPVRKPFYLESENLVISFDSATNIDDLTVHCRSGCLDSSDTPACQASQSCILALKYRHQAFQLRQVVVNGGMKSALVSAVSCPAPRMAFQESASEQQGRARQGIEGLE